MTHLSQHKLLLACCATMALGFAACDDGAANPPQTNSCGDSVCTENQECVDGKCQDIVEDPCAACTENQECVDGKCQDIVADPCDACTENQECVDGKCKDLCGSEICTENQTCDETSKTCVDKEDPCDKCTESETCVNGECVDVDPCQNKTCPDNFRCDSSKGGECVEIDPCENVVCNDGQSCLKAQCIDVECIIDGAEKDCGEGKVCSKGECVDDGCQNVSCNEGWQCLKGVCIETACIEYFCEDGRSCKGGECVDNECLDTVCDEGLICSKGNCMYEACLGKEACTIGKTCNIEGNCVFITEPAISIDEPEDKITDEAGKAITLAVRLNNQPTMDVRVTCEVESESPNQEVTAACEEIVFNADNWQIEQSIVVTGIDDHVKDGDQTYKVKIITLSEDIDFAELTAESVELTNVDQTTPGVIFSETMLTTYEDQMQPPATFTITLASIPSDPVQVSFQSSNANEGSVSPKTIKFTKDNWNVPQTVTVQGVDDFAKDNNKNYTIFFAPTASEDLDYNELFPKAIKVTNIDNDVAGLNINIPAEDFSINEGSEIPVLVKLNTQPKKEVTIEIACDDTTEAEFDTQTVTLNAENWNTGIEIKLLGNPDYIIDGDQPIKMTFTTTSEDEDYQELTSEFTGITKDIDTGDVVLSLADAAIVKEGDPGFVTISLTLASQPKDPVTVDLAVSDNTELKINKTSLKFSPNHWDLPQDVLVNSVDDPIVDGNVKSKIIAKLTSSDANFNGTKETEFTTVDDDVAAFVISSNAASFPESSGSSTSMTVSLRSQPTADVTVTVSSSDASELTVSSANTLTFTAANWNKPQLVSVKVVDDKLADGTQSAYVKFTATSADKNFGGITGQSATYTIIDDDAPSISLTATSTTITQVAPSITANMVLGIQPSSDVTVTLTPSDAKLLTLSPSKLTFTSSNWDKPQNVTVNGNFAALAAANTTLTITSKASASNSYNNVTSNPLTVLMTKVPEVQNFAFTKAVQTVQLPAGRYKLETWGAQGGNGGYYSYSGGSSTGGKGGYATGVITLTSPQTLYIYVGGQGASSIGTYVGESGLHYAGGFNGGGDGNQYGMTGGGGATDIRVGTDSLYARVIVGGGGGGGGNPQNATLLSNGGYGGGATGGTPTNQFGNRIPGKGGTLSGIVASKSSSRAAGFGLGGGGTGENLRGGGGGGWYGGTQGENSTGAGGGSGWVYTSANYSTWQSGNATDAGKYILTSPYYLTNSQMITGNASMPAPAGSTETGHSGNGYARITLVR